MSFEPVQGLPGPGSIVCVCVCVFGTPFHRTIQSGPSAKWFLNIAPSSVRGELGGDPRKVSESVQSIKMVENGHILGVSHV
jgi:hypothetical protein